MVDKEDLVRLIEFDHSWTLFKNKNRLYARTNVYGHDENGKFVLIESTLLHRWIMGVPKGKMVHVDHINHNGLDNRRSNLRVVPPSVNLTNRGPNKNNTSGYRNVFFDTARQTWCVALFKNGKNIRKDGFATAEEANTAAIAMREKYYGEYSNVFCV